MTENWNVRRVLAWTTQHFEKRGVESPRLTTEVLLAHTLGLTRVRLYTDLDRPLQKAELTAFRGLIERRVSGEPTQYLTGTREFYNRPFAVDARVLVPRPETELPVDHVLQRIARDGKVCVLDLCTGSGCIGITVAAERPNVEVWATDVSSGACSVAASNAEALKVAPRIHILQGDLFSPLPRELQFDVIVSNPPYIQTDEIATLSPEVRREPPQALDGGADGLTLIRRIIDSASDWLKPGGCLAMEIGETQGPAVAGLLQAAGYGNTRVEQDLERRDRFAIGEKAAPVGHGVDTQPHGNT